MVDMSILLMSLVAGVSLDGVIGRLIGVQGYGAIVGAGLGYYIVVFFLLLSFLVVIVLQILSLDCQKGFTARWELGLEAFYL